MCIVFVYHRMTQIHLRCISSGWQFFSLFPHHVCYCFETNLDCRLSGIQSIQFGLQRERKSLAWGVRSVCMCAVCCALISFTNLIAFKSSHMHSCSASNCNLMAHSMTHFLLSREIIEIDAKLSPQFLSEKQFQIKKSNANLSLLFRCSVHLSKKTESITRKRREKNRRKVRDIDRTNSTTRTSTRKLEESLSLCFSG